MDIHVRSVVVHAMENQAKRIRYTNKDGEERSLPELMNMDVNAAAQYCRHMNSVRPKLEILRDLDLVSDPWGGNTGHFPVERHSA